MIRNKQLLALFKFNPSTGLQWVLLGSTEFHQTVRGCLSEIKKRRSEEGDELPSPHTDIFRGSGSKSGSGSGRKWIQIN